MIYRLPFPPSVNAMYRNVPRVGRVKSKEYRKWLEVAQIELASQKPKSFVGLAMLEILLDDTRRGDCSNRIKAVEDLLVSAGVLASDRKEYVHSVCVSWAKVRGCEVRIVPVMEA